MQVSGYLVKKCARLEAYKSDGKSRQACHEVVRTWWGWGVSAIVNNAMYHVSPPCAVSLHELIPDSVSVRAPPSPRGRDSGIQAKTIDTLRGRARGIKVELAQDEVQAASFQPLAGAGCC